MTVLLALFVLAVLEIWTALAVAQVIGPLSAAVALVGLSLLGVVLVRSEGLAVWRRVGAETSSGRVPTDSIIDGLVVLCGGLLLIVPGFLTAIPGLALLFPPTRKLLRPLLHRWIVQRAEHSAGLGGVTFSTVSSGGFIDVDGHVTEPRDVTVDAHAEVVDVEVDRPREIQPPR